MKIVKRLVALLVLVALAYGAWWAWTGPLWALAQVDQGIREKDPGRVERHADLEKLAQSAAVVFAEIAKEQAGIAGPDLGSSLLGALVGAFASEVGKAVGPEAAAEMRRAIREGTMQRGIGPFVVNEGVSAFGDYQGFGTSSHLTLRGKCGELDAKLKVVLEERDAGYLFGLVTKNVLVGIDKDSAKELAKVCRAARR